MNKFLTYNEREDLKERHKKERDGRVRDRIKAILLYDDGWTCQEIAKVLLLSDEAVRQHIHDYQSSQKLKPESGGSVSKLTAEQTNMLIEHLQVHTYLFVKDIVIYVKATFGIEYTIPGMTDWLHQHDFSYKKPAIVPGKADRVLQEQWIEEYEALKQNLAKDEAICFIDGVHPTHNTQAACGWIKKGERKEIPSNTGRQRLNISGAIDICAKRVFVQAHDSLDSQSTIKFLQELEKAYPHARKVHAFCDNARYLKNKEVQAYLDQSKIQMHFLPPYSPNLNPIERLWKLMHEQVLYNRYYEKFVDFAEAVLGFLQSLFDPPIELAQKLATRVTDSFRAMGKVFAKESSVASL